MRPGWRAAVRAAANAICLDGVGCPPCVTPLTGGLALRNSHVAPTGVPPRAIRRPDGRRPRKGTARAPSAATPAGPIRPRRTPAPGQSAQGPSRSRARARPAPEAGAQPSRRAPTSAYPAAAAGTRRGPRSGLLRRSRTTPRSRRRTELRWAVPPPRRRGPSRRDLEDFAVQVQARHLGIVGAIDRNLAGVDHDGRSGRLEAAPTRPDHGKLPAQPEMPAVAQAPDIKSHQRRLRRGAILLATDPQRVDRDLDIERAGAARREVESLQIQPGQPLADPGRPAPRADPRRSRAAGGRSIPIRRPAPAPRPRRTSRPCPADARGRVGRPA